MKYRTNRGQLTRMIQEIEVPVQERNAMDVGIDCALFCRKLTLFHQIMRREMQLHNGRLFKKPIYGSTAAGHRCIYRTFLVQRILLFPL